MPNNLSSILCIGGHDSSGGAGITIDQATAAALEQPIRTLCVATTIQTDQGVQSIQPITPQELEQQLEQAFTQSIAAVKLGMLVNQDIVVRVGDFLKEQGVPIIFDPVLSATRGGALLAADAIPMLQTHLLPYVSLLTPNLPEAEHLSALPITTDHEIEQAAQWFIKQGVRAVLIKGGHGHSQESRDYLFAPDEGIHQWITAPRLDVQLRGTGCRLATAIACYIAQGLPLALAVSYAKNFVYNCLYAATHR